MKRTPIFPLKSARARKVRQKIRRNHRPAVHYQTYVYKFVLVFCLWNCRVTRNSILTYTCVHTDTPRERVRYGKRWSVCITRTCTAQAGGNSLGITHVTLPAICRQPPATVSQLFSNNRHRSVLIPPGHWISRACRVYISRRGETNEASYYCRSAALRPVFPPAPTKPAGWTVALSRVGRVFEKRRRFRFPRGARRSRFAGGILEFQQTRKNCRGKRIENYGNTVEIWLKDRRTDFTF